MNSTIPTYQSGTWETRMNHYRYWFLDLLLILILAAGGYFRFIGIRWDENQHLHPDERFLTMVENNMSPVESLGDYFNTELSTLNPHNVGHSFYVYGDFPIIFTRYIAEWTNQNTYDTVNVLGRQISASMDMLTILMVFLIGRKLYDRRIGLLAAAFYSLAVIPIQLSHFFAVDTFACFFASVAIYAAVSIYQTYREADTDQDTWRGIGYYLLFGAGLALAMASKVSTAPLAVVLPLAVFCWYIRLPLEKQIKWLFPIIRNLIIAAVFAFLLFRIFQPYAFAGPSFFDFRPNPKFVQNLTDLKGQTSGQADFPPALQWARRSKSFAFENLTLWGTGLPLGILGWAALLWMAVRMIRGEWFTHLTIWVWTVAYFIWQSVSWNPMMRYTYLIYPTFAIMAAWLVIRIWDTRISRKASQPDVPEPVILEDQSLPGTDSTPVVLNAFPTKGVLKQSGWLKGLSFLLGLVVLAGSAGWAYAFTRIYTRPVTRIEATRWIYQNIPGPVNLHYETIDGQYNQPIAYPYGAFIVEEQPLSFDFNAAQTGQVSAISFFRIGDLGMVEGEKQLTFVITDAANNQRLYTGSINSTFINKEDQRGLEFRETVVEPLMLIKGHRYNLRFELSKGSGLITISGSAPANESDWDDGLPLRMDSYDGFGGIYDGTLNFQMYWEENEEKRERFISTLDRADYIFISSNRQWGTTVRVPERYPLATAYYRNLVGCPNEVDTLVCLAKAEPGMYSGNLGFDLIKVFESSPTLGTWKINDQLAEESFTVYDHPKVFIFKKNANYDSQKVAALFNQIDIATVIHTPPGDVPSHPQNLLLPADRLASQQAGGTWSQLFQRDVYYNSHPWAAVVLWYLVLFTLGLGMVPMLLLVFPGFKDKGYGLGRISALLLVALITWWAGSFGIQVDKRLISVVVGILLLINLVLGFIQKGELFRYLRENWKHLLITEGVILLFFLIDLGIRIGNPDLWHISKGGEKPMDFAYLNAILKSTTFPPYDPWFSGGYINYYYYGFVIVGVLIKWLGIVPSIAYNLVVPTLFTLLAVGAYTILYNLVVHSNSKHSENEPGSSSPYWFAILAATGLTILGNLGTLRMIWYGLQMLAAPDGDISALGTHFFTRMLWTVQGLVKFFQGGNLPYGLGEWYWNPSRVIPAINDVEPITEFPMFTFIYADLHAHMIALPITLFALTWAVHTVLSKGIYRSGRRWQLLSLITSIVVGAVGVGALRPTNTWDFPVYAVLAGLAIAYTSLQYQQAFDSGMLAKIPNRWIRWLLVTGVFVLFTIGLYYPYDAWYGAGYTSIETWQGSHTPPWSYLTHWGTFLFFIVFWLIQETIDWMANTPLRKLAILRSYSQIMIALGVLAVAATIGLVYLGAWIAWMVVPVALWAAILLFRPGQSDVKRLVLFLIGTGLFLTLFVEIFVLKGDIGRMNTVFKFYLQVWSLFTIATSAAIYWTFCDRSYWRASQSRFFQTFAWILLLCALLFSFTATASKIRDRYVPTASHSLDGMEYMLGATYLEHDVDTNTSRAMELEQDYQAIRWMQDNVQGSPVIVEGSVTEYKWGSRYSIYTGLPSVVGWNWHQRQQRGVANPVWVQDRVNEVNQFYSTPDVEEALTFLKKYNVKYIVVGQMEDIIYPLTGTAKFSLFENVYWKPVYTYKSTTIYEVIES